MTAVLLSLLSAVLYGIGDFWGGLSTRRAHVLQVLPTILLSGTLTVFALIPILGADYSRGAIVGGLVAGIFGTAGFFLVYLALAMGPMGVASAIIAVLATAVPYAVSLLRGDPVTSLGIIGAIVAVVSILLVCYSTAEATHPPTRKMIITAVIGGFAVAGFFLGLALAPADSGLAPISITRLIQITVIGGAALVLRKRVTGGRPNYPMAVGSGVFDAAAAAAFVFASHAGSLGLVVVVSNLYPAVTVLFAHFVIHERLERHQIVGMIGACAAVALLTLAR